MRDDSHRWDAPRTDAILTSYRRDTDVDFSPVDLAAATLAPVRLERQTLVSGPDVLRRTDTPLVAWPDPAPAVPYALSLRRDRVLLVDGPKMDEGWDAAANRAVSDVTEAYAVFDLAGPGAFALLRRGAEISLDTPSRSVARLLYGLGVFLYCIENEQTFRLHVARAQAETLIKSVEEAATRTGP